MAVRLSDLAFAASLTVVSLAGAARRRPIVIVAKPACLLSVMAGLVPGATRRPAADNFLLAANAASSLVGDYVMLREEYQTTDETARGQWLVTGAACFAATQLGYLALLHRAGARPSPVRALAGAVILAQCGRLIARRDPSLAGPLVAYGALVVSMAASAGDPELADRRIGIGGMCFVVSDALIINRRLGGWSPRAQAVAEWGILISYFIAQRLLMGGLAESAAGRPIPLGHGQHPPIRARR